MQIFTTITLSGLLILFLVREGEMASKSPATATELQLAIDQAEPGDVITLLPIEYYGNFKISKSGKEGSPIIVRGTPIMNSNTTVSSSGSGTTFDIKGNFIQLKGMVIRDAEIAISAKGSNNILQGQKIENVHQGIIINGANNLLKGIQAVDTSDTGITIKGGEGNAIDGVQVSSVHILEDACCSVFDGTDIKGRLDIKSSKTQIRSTKVEGEVNIEGCETEISTSMFEGPSYIAKCNSLDDSTNMIKNLIRS